MSVSIALTKKKKRCAKEVIVNKSPCLAEKLSRPIRKSTIEEKLAIQEKRLMCVFSSFSKKALSIAVLELG